MDIKTTPGQLAVTTEINPSETSEDWDRFIEAAHNGRLEEVIELSINDGIDVWISSEALIASCEEGHLDVVRWLVEHTAADVNYNRREVTYDEEVKEYDTPLTAACFHNHLDIVKYLVGTCHADVNLPNKINRGDTSLTWACGLGNISVSVYLLCEASDLNVNIADNDGNAAMHLAVWCSKVSNTELHNACDFQGDLTEVLRLIYLIGHEINVQNNVGDTPLHLACRNGNGDIVEALMLAGADETITDDRKNTPAQEADNEGHSKLLKLLDRDSLYEAIIARRKKLTLHAV